MVRTEDRRNFVILPNNLVRAGHKPQFIAVLLVVASHAGDRDCYASAATIAKEAGTTLKTVSAALKYWEDLKQIVTVNRKKSGATTIITTTFDFVGGYGENVVPRYDENDVPPTTKKQEGYDEKAVPGTTKTSYKEDVLKKNTKEDTNPKDDETTVDENKAIGELIQIFRDSVNPVLTYGHKGERSAALRLIRAVGIEQSIVAARFAVSEAVTHDRYAPACTKPSELERNLGRLRLHYKKQLHSSNVAVV